MARFYQIQIGSIYLTKDGNSTGLPCKLEVPNVEDLLATITGVAIPSADGTPVFQLIPFIKGKTFEVKVEVLTKDVWEDLRDFLIDKLETDASFTVIGFGDIGDFEVTVKPFPQKPFSAQSFFNERIYGAIFRFITV